VTLEVQRLLETLQYRFEDPRLLDQALTHRSYVNETRSGQPRDNERFEFLGDAILDLAVSEALMEWFPSAREGELSKLRARMVSEVALARVAVRVGLGDALRLGRGEELSGGRSKASLLADAFEALIAAIYMDGGWEVTRQIVRRHLQPPDESSGLDAKTELQQRIQERYKLTPRYRLVEAQGPAHDRTFIVEVLLEGRCLQRGVGRTKKEAEQRAAANTLAELAELELAEASSSGETRADEA